MAIPERREDPLAGIPVRDIPPPGFPALLAPYWGVMTRDERDRYEKAGRYRAQWKRNQFASQIPGIIQRLKERSAFVPDEDD